MLNKMQMDAELNGRVQGVGFRALVLEYATALGLTGFVRNNEDGSVEIVAQGPQDALESLIEELQERPGFSKIESVKLKFSIIRESYSDFTINRF